jgi:hypothetical protein
VGQAVPVVIDGRQLGQVAVDDILPSQPASPNPAGTGSWFQSLSISPTSQPAVNGTVTDWTRSLLDDPARPCDNTSLFVRIEFGQALRCNLLFAFDHDETARRHSKMIELASPFSTAPISNFNVGFSRSAKRKRVTLVICPGEQ